jgi:type VI secretion system secreted protein Hcp
MRIVTGIIILLMVGAANAGVDNFLKIEGVNGESQRKGYEGQIDVLSWSIGGSQSGTTHSGTGGGAGKVNLQDFTFIHYVDKASPALFKALVSGEHFTRVKLTVRQAGEHRYTPIKIVMASVIVTSLNTGGSAGDEKLTETVTLNFQQISYTYRKQKPDGSSGSPITECWDIATSMPTCPP